MRYEIYPPPIKQNLTPRILHVDIISGHLGGVGLSDLVGGPNPEPVLVEGGQVLDLDLALVSGRRLGYLSPGSVASGGVEGLKNKWFKLLFI